MVASEDLFGKREIRKDDIKSLLDDMNRLSDIQEYERAKEILDKIKEELGKHQENEWIHVGNVQTIKDVKNLIASDSIRLNPDNYKFSDFLALLVGVHNRKNEIQGARYSDTDKQRKVVAEEMACLGMTIPESKGGKLGRSVRPNRAFLDIAHKINPYLACKELARREKVMMWKAIESGKKEDIERVREKLKKYSQKEIGIEEK